MSRFKTLLAGACAALAISGAAEAAVVAVRDNPANGSSVFAAGLGLNVSISFNGHSHTVGAGVFSLQYKSNDEWTDFLTFCLQLSERLTLPKDHYRVDGEAYFTDAEDRVALEILYGNFMNSGLGLKNASSAAAMQAIVWEVVEDGADGFNLNAGAFRLLTSDVRAEAKNLWSLLLTGNFKPIKFDVFAARGTQDLLVADVPVPAGFYLFGSALAGFAFASRRKKG